MHVGINTSPIELQSSRYLGSWYVRSKGVVVEVQPGLHNGREPENQLPHVRTRYVVFNYERAKFCLQRHLGKVHVSFSDRIDGKEWRFDFWGF